MQYLKRKLSLRSLPRGLELPLLSSVGRGRPDFVGSLASASIEETAVSPVKLNFPCRSSYVPGERLVQLKGQSFATLEMLQIGGLRRMGITTRPGERAAEHGVRNPIPYADGSSEKIEEQRRDEFLSGAKRTAAENVQNVEAAVRGKTGTSFEATDTEMRRHKGESSSEIVQGTAKELSDRSESETGGSQEEGGMSYGIDKEVERGLIADSAHPAGRVSNANRSDNVPFGGGEKLRSGSLSKDDSHVEEEPADSADKVHPYSPDKFYSLNAEEHSDKNHPYADKYSSTNEALDKGHEKWQS